MSCLARAYYPETFPTSQAAILLLCASLSVLSIGCSAPAPEVSEEQDGTMRALAMAYGQYVSQNRGRPPKDEKRLRKFVEDKQHILDTFGVESIDDMFVSPRDNEPYVVNYGKKARVVAYEKVGVDGKRMIAEDLGVVREVDEAEFAELVPNAK